MVTLKHTRGCVYQTAYHLVWRPVCGRSILAEPVKSTLEHLFHAIAHQYDMEVLAVDVQPDHIHLFVSIPPALSVADAVKLLKGISARQLRLMFSQLRTRTRSDHLWAPSYYVGTAGHVSAETIRTYIESQEQHHAQ
jgi:putative transposase